MLLAKLGVAHTVHSYPHDPRPGSFGTEAAEAMGVASCRVFKTLIAEVDASNLLVGWTRNSLAGDGADLLGLPRLRLDGADSVRH